MTLVTGSYHSPESLCNQLSTCIALKKPNKMQMNQGTIASVVQRETWDDACRRVSNVYDTYQHPTPLFSVSRPWLFDALHHSSETQATTITLTIWHIWEARNGARNNERIIHPRRIVEKIKAIYLHCYQETQQKCKIISEQLHHCCRETRDDAHSRI
jgi:hypothetical protein